MKHKYLLLILLCAISNLNSFAQTTPNCSYPIRPEIWFSFNPQNVDYSPDGTKLLVTGAPTNGYSWNPKNTSPEPRSSSAIVVVDLKPEGLSFNSNLSKGTANYYDSNALTGTGGAVTVGSGATYIDPTGATTPIPDGVSQLALSPDAMQGVYVNSNANQYYFVKFKSAAPQVTAVAIPGATAAGIGSKTFAVDNEDRLYRLVNGPNAGYYGNTITCTNVNTGSKCSNWNDIKLSTGSLSEIVIRPTDGLIFARTLPLENTDVGYQAAQPGGVVIFDKNGNLANDFNFTDLSMITNDVGTNIVNKIRFDAAGNIFANVSSSDVSIVHSVYPGVGIYKFDPKGNLDVDFMRNVTNSYITPRYSHTSGFDVNPVTGEIALGLIHYNEAQWGYALNGGEHKMINNEQYWKAFTNNNLGPGSWTSSDTPTPSYQSTDGNSNIVGVYNSVHILYNNGKLKVPGETAATQTSNCGVQPPGIVPPPAPKAVGTIDCPKTRFMPAPKNGTASNFSMIVSLTSSAAGVYTPITFSGSGMSLQNPGSSVTATTGTSDYVIPVHYDGTPLGNFTFTIGSAGTCTVDLTETPTNNKVNAEIEIWTLDKCAQKIVGPKLK